MCCAQGVPEDPAQGQHRERPGDRRHLLQRDGRDGADGDAHHVAGGHPRDDGGGQHAGHWYKYIMLAVSFIRDTVKLRPAMSLQFSEILT